MSRSSRLYTQNVISTYIIYTLYTLSIKFSLYRFLVSQSNYWSWLLARSKTFPWKERKKTTKRQEARETRISEAPFAPLSWLLLSRLDFSSGIRRDVVINTLLHAIKRLPTMRGATWRRRPSLPPSTTRDAARCLQIETTRVCVTHGGRLPSKQVLGLTPTHAITLRQVRYRSTRITISTRRGLDLSLIMYYVPTILPGSCTLHVAPLHPHFPSLHLSTSHSRFCSSHQRYRAEALDDARPACCYRSVR